MSQHVNHPYGPRPVYVEPPPAHSSQASMSKNTGSFVPTTTMPKAPATARPLGASKSIANSSAFPGTIKPKSANTPFATQYQPATQTHLQPHQQEQQGFNRQAPQQPQQTRQQHHSQSQPSHQQAPRPQPQQRVVYSGNLPLDPSFPNRLTQSQSEYSNADHTQHHQGANVHPDGTTQLKSALKQSNGNVATAPVRVKPQPADEDYQNPQDRTYQVSPLQQIGNRTRSHSTGARYPSTQPFPHSSPSQVIQEHGETQQQHPQPQNHRQESNTSDRRNVPSRPASPNQYTIADSIEMGRNQGILKHNSPLNHSHQNFIGQAPLSPPSEDNPEETFGSIDQTIEEALSGANNVYDTMRIKDEWYPRAIAARDAEIARLADQNINLQQQLQKAVNDKTITIARAREYYANCKQSDALDRATAERHEGLSKVVNDTIEDMKNFREKELVPVSNELATLMTTFTSIRTTFSEIKSDISNSSGLTEKLKTIKEENTNLKASLKEQRSNIGNIQTKLEHYEQGIAPTLQKIDGSILDLKKNKDSDQPALNALVQKNTELSERLVTTETELTKAQDKLNASIKISESYESAMDECIGALRLHGCDGEDPKSMLTDLEEKHCQELKEIKDKLENQLNDAKLRSKATTEFIEELQKDLDAAQQKADKAETISDEKDKLSKQVTELKDKVKRMETSIKNVEADRERLEERYNESTAHLQDVKLQLTEAEGSVKNLKNQITESEKQDLKQLKEQVKSVQSTSATLLEKLAAPSVSIPGGTINKLEQDLEMCKKELQQKTAELAMLQSKPEEDSEAAVQRYQKGTYSQSERRLVEWAMEIERDQLKITENKWRNEIKSLSSDVNKLKKQVEEKNKQIELLTQAASIQPTAGGALKGKSVRIDDTPSLMVPPPRPEAPSFNNVTSRNKRKIDLSTLNDEDPTGPPSSSQKRSKTTEKEKATADKEEYWDEVGSIDDDDIEEELKMVDHAMFGENEGAQASTSREKQTLNINTNDMNSDLSDFGEPPQEEEQRSVQPPATSQGKNRNTPPPSQSGRNKQQPKAVTTSKTHKAKTKAKKSGDDDEFELSGPKVKKSEKKNK